MYFMFAISLLFSRGKERGPSFAFSVKKVEIGSMVLEKIFKMTSMYLCYFVIISIEKERGPSFELN